ncbi:substrate-binding domain-containing protein [Nonomuraea sp. NEAU-L178]|nr:substrate-binding domain-containing protein [Nonomuraea aurantiaca]MCA2224639.1 substrate-binding domain-containing protein [Nonomuraea aurantiaca]
MTGPFGYDAITSLPADSGVTAVVAANDLLAMGAVRAALSRGWTVPQDLSVFGWDDEEMGRFATPALSTVAVDREKQGCDAMLRLIAAVRGEPVPEVAESTINQLIIRETTGAARRPT